MVKVTHMSRPTQIIIDLSAIKANCTLARSLAPLSNIVAVVKADAYGHGAIEVAKALEPQVQMLTVSCLEEAQSLRRGGISKAILLLEGCFSEAEIFIAEQLNLQLVVHNQQQVDQLINTRLNSQLKIWLKIDTGMHRLGIAPESVEDIYQQLSACPNVSDVVLTTHFASADRLDSDFTLTQLSLYKQAVSNIIEQANEPIEQSIANSAGVLAWPQSRLDWNRPGIMLYGLSPFANSHEEANKLVPAMTFKSQIIALRTIGAGESVGYGNTWIANQSSVIATVAVGYGDGYPRTAKSGTPVLVGGKRAKLVGNVSMDMICVDVTELHRVEIGDEVEMWGKILSANEVATWADTIGYELVTRMPTRAKRSYVC
ncbi:MAG: alanine racemase [Paraglaciecola sp.]|jgi:alanine racemase